MDNLSAQSAAVIVAHPDDEVLWAGGFMLIHDSWKWHVACTCRQTDPDRSPRFWLAMEALNSSGSMGNLDDGPEQKPMPAPEVEAEILRLLPAKDYDLILTHHPRGEYTRHIRHEEVSKAVVSLWRRNAITAREMWIFAYTDDSKTHLPEAVRLATVRCLLSRDIWQKKYRLITQVYGFAADSFEAQTTPIEEAFWILTDPHMAPRWLSSP